VSRSKEQTSILHGSQNTSWPSQDAQKRQRARSFGLIAFRTKIAEIHLLRHCRDRDVMFGRRDMEHKATEVYRYHRSLRDSLSDSRLKSLKSFRSIPLVLVFASIALPDQCLLRLRPHTSPTVPLTLDPLAYQSPPSATIASRRSWTSGLMSGCYADQ